MSTAQICRHRHSVNTPPMIVFGEDWGGHPSSTQHLMNHLRHNFDVLWINSLGLRRPRLNSHDLRRLYQKGKQLLSTSTAHRQTTNPPPFPVKNVPAIPWPGQPLISRLNSKLISNSLKTYLKQWKRRPILWTSLPSALPAVGHLGECATVYYCGDDFNALAGVDHSAVTAMELELSEAADVIFVASEELAKKFPASKTMIIPHGVDFPLFSEPQPMAQDMPKGKPIAGFYGALADWVDVGLLSYCAEQLPGWNFIFIGPVQTDITPLLNRPNVFLLGKKPHDKLASYSQHWTVSLLPFRDNEQIKACNPLKLREYLASGKPIVSTEFPALSGYRDLISIQTSPAEFCQAIRRSELDSNTSGRQQRVVAESWAARAEAISRRLGSLGRERPDTLSCNCDSL